MIQRSPAHPKASRRWTESSMDFNFARSRLRDAAHSDEEIEDLNLDTERWTPSGAGKPDEYEFQFATEGVDLTHDEIVAHASQQAFGHAEKWVADHNLFPETSSFVSQVLNT